MSEKIDGQFIRIEDNKLSKSEYEHAHEALLLRVQTIEQKMDTELKSADATHEKIETSVGVRYDKLDARITTLDTKLDSLKDNMILRFENQATTQAANRRSTTFWAVALIIGLLGGSGSCV